MKVPGFPVRIDPMLSRQLGPPGQFLNPLFLLLPAFIGLAVAIPQQVIQLIPLGGVPEPLAFVMDNQLRNGLGVMGIVQRGANSLGRQQRADRDGISVALDNLAQSGLDRTVVRLLPLQVVVGWWSFAEQLQALEVTSQRFVRAGRLTQASKA